MARGVGTLVKKASGMVAQVPGAEGIVLQAVRDMFSELKQLRRENARLRAEVDRLRQRLAVGRGRPATSTTRTTKTTATRRPKKSPKRRTTAARTTTSRRRRPRRGVLDTLLGPS